MSNDQYNQAVQEADAVFSQWCKKNQIPLHGIRHVITWESWDDGIGVYFFLHKISEVKMLQAGQFDEMKTAYLRFLEGSGYPFDRFPNVVFEIDSDENVRKNFGGSYFNRLR